MFYTLLSIAIGSVIGGWSRWYIGLKLNSIYPAIPLGTVFVNLIGGFIIGFAIAYFTHSSLNPNYKLLIVTGFCGGLTTFSTFSAEIVTLLMQGRLGMACLAVTIHVVGAVCMTFLGILTQQYLYQ
ncbi:fluoride efflux transporter CrcB [Acinetobacter qingfengensis]|uniref:Fluoride-specific ion channel FluC n=1 Tax=Acinetobacter qingfengensis TaxID=1262585 RepID=A0A1E7RA50_9GAMM|nr:fluoride efflux transporter CrcB [Acinetobacter qingfengensis]KAA8733920.1 fluoride efflux transporter CrcB [Acinetobacter qingfengensis]OEY96161.1 fluoride ion transporter CrcB [Acinetobacter qingfengensis]